jgi:hypothetical protein
MHVPGREPMERGEAIARLKQHEKIADNGNIVEL